MRTHLFVGILSSLALAGSVCSQTVLLRVDGNRNSDRMGSGVAGIGDVTGDGVPDFVSGGIIDNSVNTQEGFVRAFDGASGADLYSVSGSSALDFFGHSLGSAGDVNGDGHCDFIVGAPFDDPGGVVSGGSASVYSGLDGTLIHRFEGAGANDQLGWSVDGAGDVNADGFADLVVGAWLQDCLLYTSPTPRDRTSSRSL